MGMQILVPTGRETAVLISVSLGALVNLCLNLLWIPAYACAGAAAATLAAETVVLLAQVFFLRDTLRRLPLSPAPQSPLLGTAAASLISLPVKLTGLTPFPALLLSACLFFSSYALVLLALRDPLAREVWQLLTRRGKTSL